jgi:hypothetical protein
VRAPDPRSVARLAVAAVLAAVVASGALRALAGLDLLEWLPAFPLCPFRAATGLPCPGCGMTRAFLLLGQLRLGEAWALQPAAPFLLCGMLVFLARPVVLPRRARTALAGGALACVLAAWAVRLA